jgi:hypothetical protein
MDKPSKPPARRVAGMPVEAGHRLPRVDPTEQRVLGLPLSWYGTPNVDFSGFRHPIRWTERRIRIHRLGPYAPEDNKL